MRVSFTSQRATREGGAEGVGENLHGREGDWTQTYVTKQKEPRERAYLRRYIQVNWGHCTWKIPPGLPGTTARCLRKREREMVSGWGTGTLHLGDHMAMQTRKAEK